MTVTDIRMATYHVLNTVGSKDVKRNVAPYWARQGHNYAGRGVSADGNPSSKEAVPSGETAWNHGAWKGEQRDQGQQLVSGGKKAKFSLSSFGGLRVKGKH